jgi:hypothetical protein
MLEEEARRERKKRGGVALCTCTASTEHTSEVSQVPDATAMPTLR